MTLRARQRDDQRWRRQRHLMRLANPRFEWDDPLHLHLIRRDERGGLFLPALPRDAAERMNWSDRGVQLDLSDPSDEMDQKGSAA